MIPAPAACAHSHNIYAPNAVGRQARLLDQLGGHRRQDQRRQHDTPSHWRIQGLGFLHSTKCWACQRACLTNDTGVLGGRPSAGSSSCTVARDAPRAPALAPLPCQICTTLPAHPRAFQGKA